jgi:hypothetical protein
MTRARPTEQKRSPPRRGGSSTSGSDGTGGDPGDPGFEELLDALAAARSPDAVTRGASARGSEARAAIDEPPPGVDAVIAGATDDDGQLRAFAAAIARAVALPADAFVIGEPVEVVAIDYQGHPRAGLTARCRRDGTEHGVSLADVAFLPGSAGAHLASMYRAWLGIDEPVAVATGAARSGKRHKATGDDLDLSQPLDLVVLACKTNTLRCRIPGTARELTLRTAVRDEVPGEIITVRPSKQWSHAGHPYLSGKVLGGRPDALALGLVPLGLRERGAWDPALASWGDAGAPIDDWARPIIARGKRPRFELEQVIPGQDHSLDSDPILEAVELVAAGARSEAHELLMALLAQDLRCLAAHAHLGDLASGYLPGQALRHYGVGMSIGVLTLGTTFDGVLEWGHLANRPFLRCLRGLGLCAWRLGNVRAATACFRKLLWLDRATTSTRTSTSSTSRPAAPGRVARREACGRLALPAVGSEGHRRAPWRVSECEGTSGSAASSRCRCRSPGRAGGIGRSRSSGWR